MIDLEEARTVSIAVGRGPSLEVGGGGFWRKTRGSGAFQRRNAALNWTVKKSSTKTARSQHMSVFLCREASACCLKPIRLAKTEGRRSELTVSQKRGQPRLNVMYKRSLPGDNLEQTPLQHLPGSVARQRWMGGDAIRHLVIGQAPRAQKARISRARHEDFGT